MSADENPTAADREPGAITRREQRLRLDAQVEIVLLRHGEPDWTPGGGLSVEDEFTVWALPPRRNRIVLVAHGGTNAVALTHLLDVPAVPWEWNRFELELAAYAVAQSRPVGMTGFVWCLQNFNEVDHLRAAGLR